MNTGTARRRTGPVRRLTRSISERVKDIGAHPMLSTAAASELWTEFRGGHPVGDDYEHFLEAIAWLVRAQDATPDGGISRGYSLVRHDEFGQPGWQPSYPETTGYIIPTLYAAAELFNRPVLAARAELAARWEVSVQMSSGAVRGGTMAAEPSPAIFNTGQVLFGWLAALARGDDGHLAGAAIRASDFLVSCQDHDGHWRRGQSRFADEEATLYNARTAWALAEAGHRFGRSDFRDAAARALSVVAKAQHPNGWLPFCCLNQPRRPLLHTLAYAMRGLIEGGRVLEDVSLIEAGARAARAVAACVEADGWVPGRLTALWKPAVSWSCLTGNVQMANVWFRLRDITGDQTWLEPIPRVLAFVKATQNRTTDDPGIRGGIKGAMPVTGDYGRLEVLSWATKFFADALMRNISMNAHVATSDALTLA
jgi:uncharacterized protein YyaL (SSP411 family)